MGSEVVAHVVDDVNMAAMEEEEEEEETSRKRPFPSKKNHAKVPRRVRKAEREKMKREQLNELFLDLANALDLSEQNNGKASVLREATRLLKDFFCQIESLKKENVSLISETHYVTMEKNEMEEENSALEAQIKKLQGEIELAAQSRADLLNVHSPHFKLHQSDETKSLLLSTMEPSLHQGPAVLVVPFHPHHQVSLSAPNVAELLPKATSSVSKPHARYPNPADSWPSQLLGKQTTSS